MSNFTFFKAFNLLQEADAPPAPPGPGGMGGPPGGDLGGLGGPPGMGGPPGGPPGGGPGDMGGGPQGQPIEIKAIPAGDVWKLLEKIARDEKYKRFFEDIHIAKKQAPTTHSKQPEKKKALKQ